MENNIFYNYVYLDPRKPGDFNYGEFHFDYEPFYVGKGCNGRYKGKHRKNIDELQKEIRSFGFEVIYHLLYEKSSEDYAYDMEKELIQAIGRKDLGLGPLLNKCDGGWMPINVICTEETRKKLSKANKGKKISEETRMKIKKSLLGRKRPPETIEKMRKSLTGRKLTEEHKRKVRESNIGKHSHQKRPLDVVEKIRKSMTGKKHTEETKRKISLGLEKSYKEKRRKSSAGRNYTEERKKKLIEIQKFRYENGLKNLDINKLTKIT